MKVEKYTEQIKSYFANWFLSIGFNLGSKEFGCFTKESEHYLETIFISVEVTKNGEMILGAISTFSRKIKLIESFWEEYKETPLKITGGIPKTFGGDLPRDFLFDERNQPKKIDNWLNLQEAEPHMVERVCKKVKSDYYSFVLPKLDEYSNIHKLDALANGEDKTFSLGNESDFRKLIITKLAGNLSHESIYHDIHLRVSNGIKKYGFLNKSSPEEIRGFFYSLILVFNFFWREAIWVSYLGFY